MAQRNFNTFVPHGIGLHISRLLDSPMFWRKPNVVDHLKKKRQPAQSAKRKIYKLQETLLKEIHHRITNDVQLIKRLTRLRSPGVEDYAKKDATSTLELERINAFVAQLDGELGFIHEKGSYFRVKFNC